MKCLIIDDVHPSIAKEMSKYMTVEKHFLPSQEELIQLIPDVDLLIMRVDPQIDRAVLDAAKSLRAIGVCSVGTNHIDMACAGEKGIKVYNAPGRNANAVAELTFSKMVDLSRHVMTAHNAVTERHEWNKYNYLGRELRGHTLGILGFGRIGKRVCEMAQVFHMDVIAYDPFLKPEDFERCNARGVSLEELMRNSDYITIHMPLTPETDNLFCKKTFDLMKNDCVILNMSRGGIVNEKDLYQALINKEIGAYGADVLENELAGHGLTGHDSFVSPLFDLDNFIISPHIGAQTVNAYKDIADLILKEVKEEFELQ